MKSQSSIAAQIVGLIQAEAMPPGSHLPAQMLADRLRVSRSPVNEALRQLADKGLVARMPNRGYFVAPDAPDARSLSLDNTPDPAREAYFRIADDLLGGALPDAVTESLLRQRYGLTASQLNAVLDRIGAEGWIERRPGYGWEFSAMMRTPDALLQSYRLRLALEPAALLEPGYRLDPPCWRAAAAESTCWTAASRPTARTSCTIAACAFTNRWSKRRATPSSSTPSAA